LSKIGINIILNEGRQGNVQMLNGFVRRLYGKVKRMQRHFVMLQGTS